MNDIAITVGNNDGVGLEVACKALAKIGFKKNHRFIIFTSNKVLNSPFLKLLSQSYCYKVFKKYSDFEKQSSILGSSCFYIIASNKRPTYWVEEATQLGINNKIKALVTGPLSKIESQRTHGLNGHTELFRNHVKTPLFMTFIGKFFNVLLLTDHIPLNQVPRKINKKLITNAFLAADNLLPIIGSKPIAMIGLNPHAGEDGHLGSKEQLVIKPAITNYNKYNATKAVGPLVPDIAFLKQNWPRYSLYISPYHDQGLTAFKIIHEQRHGIQITLGLPFVRTSVDHGTAHDIFNKNIAHSGSMEMAIKYALKLIKL